MALGQTPAALPATTSPDAVARQSGLPATAACLGMGALDGKMRMTPRLSPPPAALAAPSANTVCDASGIETAGGDVEGVAQRAPTSSPLCAVDVTAQTVAAALAARVGVVTCTDGCVGGTCGEMHARTFVPAAILAAKSTGCCQPLYPRGNNTGHCHPPSECHHRYAG